MYSDTREIPVKISLNLQLNINNSNFWELLNLFETNWKPCIHENKIWHRFTVNFLKKF